MLQVQSIVDQHHQNIDAKVASKVRFQEPGTEADDNSVTEEPSNEVCMVLCHNMLLEKYCLAV